MPLNPPRRYRSDEEDSARWLDFPIRAGDIVISTRSKSGTTWMQMICALLVFQTPELPAPLPTLSPWLDWTIAPQEQTYAQLAAQRHRRFIKTHTPLDGIPLHPQATYIVVARNPLDMAVSFYHQDHNLDFDRIQELTGSAREDRRDLPASEYEALRKWIDRESDPYENLDSLPGVMMHLSDAWRRREAGNVLLLHYDDLSSDLDGQMRKLASELNIEVPADRWPALVEAATFTHMRRRADELAPGINGVFKDSKAFFHRGQSGVGRELLNADELAAYRERVAGMAPADMLAWLHRDA